MTIDNDDTLTQEILEYRNTNDFHVERGRMQMTLEILSWLGQHDSHESYVICKAFENDFLSSRTTPIAESLGYSIDFKCLWDTNTPLARP